jgi:serine phosphatase RsbU (regulator of sigma subunit)
MKRTIDNTLVSEVKGQKSSSDLNCEYEFDLLGEERYNAVYENDFVQVIDKGPRLEQYPISIEKLRDILDVLEKNECNYVSIDYNCDHPDYTFYGVDIHVATQAEIDEADEKEKQTELEEINKSLAKLEKEKERILKLAEKLKTK